jgi:hypothetical protein
MANGASMISGSMATRMSSTTTPTPSVATSSLLEQREPRRWTGRRRLQRGSCHRQWCHDQRLDDHVVDWFTKDHRDVDGVRTGRRSDSFTESDEGWGVFMARPTISFRSATVLGFMALALATAGCGAGSGDDGMVDRRSAALLPTIEFVNGLTFSVSLLPGVGTAAEANTALPGESIVAAGDLGACVGIARSGDITRIALLVEGNRMTVGTPAKCSDSGSGQVAVRWRADEVSGTRRLDSAIPETQLCLERLGLLEVQARIEPAGTAC